MTDPYRHPVPPRARIAPDALAPRFQLVPDIARADRVVTQRTWLGLAPTWFMLAWAVLSLLAAPLVWVGSGNELALIGVPAVCLLGVVMGRVLHARQKQVREVVSLEVHEDGLVCVRADGGWTRFGWQHVAMPALEGEQLVLWLFDGGAFVATRDACAELGSLHDYVRERARWTAPRPVPGRTLLTALALQLVLLATGASWLWAGPRSLDAEAHALRSAVSVER